MVISSVLDSVVDEKGTDGDLCTDVGELGTETEEHVVLLPE